MGGSIFISYRRETDSAFAGRLYDRLEHVFGREQVFIDVDSIAPGEDFVAVLESQVAACDVLLALIGRGWLTSTDAAGQRRLDNPDDFVRIEIAAALAQGKRVIPVLSDNVLMPRAEELPEEIKPLARRQSIRLTHDRFTDDAARLVGALEKALAKADAARQADEMVRRKVEEEARQRRELERQRAKEEARRQAEAVSLTKTEVEHQRAAAVSAQQAEDEKRQHPSAHTLYIDDNSPNIINSYFSVNIILYILISTPVYKLDTPIIVLIFPVVYLIVFWFVKYGVFFEYFQYEQGLRQYIRLAFMCSSFYVL